MKGWRPILTAVAWVGLVMVLLPRQGMELVEKWAEEQKVAVGAAYAKSQYVQGEAGEKIDDGQLYLYAGLAYTQGQDPTTINFEHPPLGKYLWGISWQFFGNPLFLNLPVAVAIFLVFYCLGEKLQIKSWLLIAGQGCLALMLGSGCLTQTMLDYQLLLWTLVFFYLLLGKKETGQKYLLLGLVMGGLMATKYPVPNILPYGLIFLWWMYQKKSWRWLPVSVISVAVAYLGSYGFYFAAGHDLRDWWQFEKYRLDWWTGERPLRWQLIWQLLFTGGYPAWWEEGWHRDENWNLLLPGLLVMSAVSGCLTVWKKWKKQAPSQSNEVLMMVVFSWLMMGIYTLGSAGAIRYVWIVAPIWYLVMAYGWGR